MSLKNYKIVGLTTLALGLVSTAQAGFVTTSNVAPVATTIGIVNNNEFKSILAGYGVTEYTLGAKLGVNEIGSVTYYYYGKEAGYQNVFTTGPLSYSTGFSPTWQNNFGHPVTIGTVDNLWGILDFRFCSYSAPGVGQGCVTNTQNDALGLNYRQSIAYSVSGNTAWLFWDDSGAGPDDNHDDMIIKAVFTPKAVPEPATLGLFGLGLLGVWAGSRRRLRKA